MQLDKPTFRFLLAVVAASLSASLAVLTVVWSEWIEALTGLDPDHGNGSAEWLVVLALALVAVGATVVARGQWRQRHAAAAVGSA
ncbi:MAG TPA: hypothetical protein VH538_03620 [Gaiellaceae bacterium]|jgi:hypothetical protein